MSNVSVSERVGFSVSLNTKGRFRDESFQAVDCTGTNDQKQGNKTKHHIHPKHKRKNKKTAIANKTNYTFCDLQSRNGAVLFLQPWSPHGAA